MFDIDDFFEITIKVLIILFIILGLILLTGATIYLYKRDILNQNEKIKILEQSLNEQIQEKEVYMNLLEQREEQ